MRALFYSLVGSLLCGGCHAADDACALGLRVQGLDGRLPDDLASVSVTWTVGNQPAETRSATLAQLSTDEQRLSLTDLPPETPIRVRIEGLDDAGMVAHVASVGPLRLGAREQVRVKVVLMPRNQAIELTSAGPAPRFLHSATALPDGRVLIAGGFAAPEQTDCPAQLPEGSECYSLSALKDAWAFDPTSATFAELPTLLEARAGHTATLLPGERVLLAGGASFAQLYLVPDALGPEPMFLAVDDQGAPSTLASFELFDARPATQAEQRDPARGSFVGSPGQPARPGALLSARFLHGAAAAPLTPSRVVLVGGQGSAARSYEVFDAERDGGPGVLPASVSELLHARSSPLALSLRDGEAGWIWLFGGRLARSNEELAERWAGNQDDAVGFLAPGTDSAFPNEGGDDTTARPAYALVHPVGVAMAGGSHALVTGGLGPRCDASGAATFLAMGALVSRCASADVLRTALLMEAATGQTAEVLLPSPHLLGAGAALEDGRAVLAGGFATLELAPTPLLHVLELAAPLAVEERSLDHARAMHTITAMPGLGLLSVGGVTYGDAGLELVSQVAELLWL